MSGDGGSVGAIARLRAVVARLGELEDGGGEAGRWFAEQLGVYDAAGGQITADVAFGVAPAPGQEGWWTLEARSKRDALLCELAARFYSGEPSARHRSDKISKRLRQFAAGARLWRPGTLEELLHYVTAIGLPTSARTVRRALRAGQLLPAIDGPGGGVIQRHAETQTTAADC
jgi:hypothetical protein